MTTLRRGVFAGVFSGVVVALGFVSAGASTANTTGKLVAVGAENEYADVISQIGGKYVTVSAIESNPNTDPHSFEASPAVARVVASASLIVQNGLGYDTYMNRIESASPSTTRKVIVAQQVRGLPDSTPNPHLWYSPVTMPEVAKVIAHDLGALQPAHAAYFQANLTTFDNSLKAWTTAIAALKARYDGAAVASTEPVADYLLQAAGIDNRTPWAFQADVMNGVDPSPQNVTTEQQLFTQHKVKVFVYNQQVTDSLTGSLLALARNNGIPVVGVYETMPTPGYDFQSWMVAEVGALQRALSSKQSTTKL